MNSENFIYFLHNAVMIFRVRSFIDNDNNVVCWFSLIFLFEFHIASLIYLFTISFFLFNFQSCKNELVSFCWRVTNFGMEISKRNYAKLEKILYRGYWELYYESIFVNILWDMFLESWILNLLWNFRFFEEENLKIPTGKMKNCCCFRCESLEKSEKR